MLASRAALRGPDLNAILDEARSAQRQSGSEYRPGSGETR